LSRGISLSKRLTADQLATLFDKVQVRKPAKKEVLVSEGDYDDHLYAVAAGEFEVSRKGARGQEILGRLGPGTMAGELAFLDGGLPRTASIEAATDGCCVITLRREDLEALLFVDPSLVYKVMRAIVRSVHRTVSKLDAVYSGLVHDIAGK
jgi:CRP/FNR family transcriptional regulator, cyclic AMP receptor protein